ncbi:radical SAM domain-containing protein [Caballeronia arationis]|uniref:RiPP maturation radical SAM C-methyltransferase n=1 Tax=Caballeronia arationis TaxID=1777142 RepID=UPI00074C69D9|nr:RiPP maturation radical SAM C-methyltransferase [Caballeronia arationis]SAL06943.1 radical SAM domain-containing protein [Caballeronia arationis]
MPEVILIAAPYAALERPSIGISQLKQNLLDAGIDTVCKYLTFEFAELIGLQRYCALGQYTNPAELVGEFTFSKAAFPDFNADEYEYARQVCTPSYGHQFVFSTYFLCNDPKSLAIELRKIRTLATEFIKRSAAVICEMSPRIVGCTSTFEQHCASLALLREVKRIRPDIITMLGGANCDSAMGAQTAASFPWIDYVISGEANETLPTICNQILAGDARCADHQVGVLTRRSAKLAIASRCYPLAVIENVDTIPVPCFADYFEALSRYSMQSAICPGVTAETSRGCWYGAVKHCTFCGLNDNSIAFRSKSADNAYRYLKAIRERYSIADIALTDNILDLRYIRSVFNRFNDEGIDVRFFVETKANLKKNQVEEMAENGIRWIQPGVESLSTSMCELLDKGTNCLTNLALLKFCLEEGIHVSWNMLVGAPGESDVWFDEICELIPSITHLQPPTGVSRVRYDRFSPYYEQQCRFGLSLKPYWSYSFVYPLEISEIKNLAYFFQSSSNFGSSFASSSTIERLKSKVREWRDIFGDAFGSGRRHFQIRPGLDRDVVLDTRDGTRKYHVLTGLYRDLYRACREPTLISTLHLRPEVQKYGVTESATQQVVAWFKARQLVLLDSKKILALANYPPKRLIPRNDQFPGGYVSVETQS